MTIHDYAALAAVAAELDDLHTDRIRERQHAASRRARTLGMPANEVAQRLGVSRATVYNWWGRDTPTTRDTPETPR